MPTPAASKQETRRQLLAAVQACEDKKGEDTRVLELDPADSGLADFFLITSATNDRQVVAIADEIEYRLKKEFGLYATSVEGRSQAEWILLDYSDIVIHVFLAEKRAFYDIERLRKSARNLSAAQVEEELKSALTKKTLAVRKSVPEKKAAQKSIPKTALSSTSNAKTLKGESTVPVKKAAKKAAKKAVKKAVKPVAKKAAAAAKPAPKAAKKAAAKPAVKKAAPKAAKKVVAPAATALAPAPAPSPIVPVPGRGAKPPILKAEAPPEALNLAASATPAPAKKAAKKKS